MPKSKQRIARRLALRDRRGKRLRRIDIKGPVLEKDRGFGDALKDAVTRANQLFARGIRLPFHHASRKVPE